jgi:hypothetical protein
MESIPKLSPLAEVERRILAEGQEWMRQRMQQELQALADEQGEISPLKRPAAGPAQNSDHPAADRHGSRRD